MRHKYKAVHICDLFSNTQSKHVSVYLGKRSERELAGLRELSRDASGIFRLTFSNMQIYGLSILTSVSRGQKSVVVASHTLFRAGESPYREEYKNNSAGFIGTLRARAGRS